MAQSDKKTKRAARDARLAAALRENLKRRKAQARDRAAGASGRRETRPDGSDAEGKK
jgi:Arc/MetJ family transcription regulator